MIKQFIIPPGAQLPDGYIIKEYVSNRTPRVQARGYVTEVTPLTEGVLFFFHIFGYESLGEGEFYCAVLFDSPLYPLIKNGIMLELDGEYNGISLRDIKPIPKGGSQYEIERA